MDMGQYLELFIEESKEHLQSLNQQLLELEKDPQNMTILNEIFRVAHTIKGMAGTMGFSKIATLTHDMENVLSEIRNGKFSINTHIVDVLFKCLDALENYVDCVINEGSEGENEYTEIINALNKIIENNGVVSDDQEKSQINETQQVSQQEVNKSDFINDIYTQNAINKAIEQNMFAFRINIKLSQDCVLKAARAFIVFRTIEEHCEVIKADPSVEDIEDEKFDFEFTVAVVTNTSKEILEKEINNISEISQVIISPLVSNALHNNEPVINEEKEIAQSSENNTVDKQNQNRAESQQQSVKPRTRKTVRVDIDRLDNLMNLVSELIIIKTRLEDIDGTDQNLRYGEAVEYLERITTSLHDAVMKVRMVPVETVFNRFPRMIRDLAKDLNKKIKLNMYGAETEVDRTVIDEIGDPLIHLLRNSADHGIESPEIRKANNKSEYGTINLKAYHDGNTVVIEVQDDGAGIDIDKVRKKAIERGLVDKDIAQSLSPKEIMDFLFKASFSTAKKVTDVSGRGVGLDVVKNKIEALGGIVEIKSEKGEGTKFIIRLPLTLAIIQALMVMLGEEKYAIPLSSIKEIINVNSDEIKLVQKREVILLRDTVIPLIRLEDVLDVPESENQENKQITIVIVKKGDKLSGFIVDRLIGQQEIVIKSLGKYLSGTKHIAGATILGDGQVALILDVNSLAL